MKRHITHKSLLLTICLFLQVNLLAQTSKAIDVEYAGTLAALIDDAEKYEITELTLTGSLNGTDYSILEKWQDVIIMNVKHKEN